MDTVFSIDVRDPGDWAGPIAEVVAWLHRVDALFSTYRSESEISRLGRGELTVAAADPLVAEVFRLCERFEVETGGYFTARWRGTPDPTGLVKGWAIERASALLRERGSRNHAVNGGGDVGQRRTRGAHHRPRDGGPGPRPDCGHGDGAVTHPRRRVRHRHLRLR